LGIAAVMGGGWSAQAQAPATTALPPGCPVSDDAKVQMMAATAGGGCPVQHGENEKTPLACSSDELNPKNLMFPENQRPAQGQRMPLPTNRQTSSIPQVCKFSYLHAFHTFECMANDVPW
jgi:hypothetical protein